MLGVVERAAPMSWISFEKFALEFDLELVDISDDELAHEGGGGGGAGEALLWSYFAQRGDMGSGIYREGRRARWQLPAVHTSFSLGLVVGSTMATVFAQI
jgi:hypothetical protein